MQHIVYFILLPYAIFKIFLINKYITQVIYIFNKNKAIFYFY